jgi:hypothetical protein
VPQSQRRWQAALVGAIEAEPESFLDDTELADVMHRAGGMWRATRDATVTEVVAEVERRGIRAMYFRSDVEAARHLPQLEHVQAQDVDDISPLAGLRELRSLFLTAWRGRLDAEWWPHLERFGANELPRGGGGVDTVVRRSDLRALHLDGYAEETLRPIGSTRLETLRLFRSRRLTALDPTDAVAASVIRLSLDQAPSLASAAGLERFEQLEVLKLEALPHVTSIDFVAELPRLRFLGIADLKNVETLRPLAGHPSLEYVQCGPPQDLDPEPLREIPRLRMVQGFNSVRWSRTLDGLPTSRDFAEDDPVKVEWSRLVHSVD